MAKNSKEEVKVYKLKKRQTLPKKDNMDDDKVLYETFLNRQRLDREKQTWACWDDIDYWESRDIYISLLFVLTQSVLYSIMNTYIDKEWV